MYIRIHIIHLLVLVVTFTTGCRREWTPAQWPGRDPATITQAVLMPTVVWHGETLTVAPQLTITDPPTIGNLWDRIDGDAATQAVRPLSSKWVSTKRLRLVFHFADNEPLAFYVTFHTRYDIASITELNDWTTYDAGHPSHYNEYESRELRHILEEVISSNEVHWVSGNIDNWKIESHLHYRGK